jgi:uncharacterized protein (DUF983 family)
MPDAPVAPLSPYRVGLAGRCPRCGEGKLFAGFLTVGPRCEACGLDFAFADSGDGPAFFIMSFVGHLVVALALWVEFTYAPPIWLHLVIWFSLTARAQPRPRAPRQGPLDRPAVPPPRRRGPHPALTVLPGAAGEPGTRNADARVERSRRQFRPYSGVYGFRAPLRGPG